MTQHAIVTGASSGIGEAFARALAGRGYRITAVARGEDKLQSLIAELGEPHQYRVADLSDSAQVKELGTFIEKEGCNLLINNAGYAKYQPFHTQDLETDLNMVRLNVDAVAALSYAFLQQARPGDALLNVSSGLSVLPMPGGAVYSGTKGFVTNFTEALWYENKDRGIYVLAVLPGSTRTNFHDVATDGKGRVLSERMTQLPEEVVAEALAALHERRRPSLITGRNNRLLTWIATKFLSRKQRLALLGRRSPGMRS